MSQTQSLKKKSAQDSGEKQSLQRSAHKNSDEALNKKATATPEETPALQKKIYRTAEPEQPEGNAQRKPRLQTKLSVSEPGDSHEQEADRVADEVVSRSAAPVAEENKLNPGNTKPENNAASPQSLQTKISRMEEPAAESAPVETEVPSTETEAATDAAANSEQGVSEEVERQIAGMRGQGAQLPEQLRTELEGQFNHDFSSVSIHTGGTADALCKQLSARAFTVGSDIFFASGEYAPDSQEGKRLLAHELTHVVQQGSGVTRKIMRDVQQDPSGPGTYIDSKEGINYKYEADARPKKLTMSVISIPQFKKQRHSAIHNALKPFYVRRGSRDTHQRENWRSGIPIANIDLKGPFRDMDEGFNAFKSGRNENFFIFGTKAEIEEKIVEPFWDRNHEPKTFQVDHRVEDQMGGNPSGDGQKSQIDTLENYELLESGANGRSGGAILREIDGKIRSGIGVFKDSTLIGGGARRISGQLDHVKTNYIVEFTDLSASNLENPDNSDIYWSVSDVEQGRHLTNFRTINETERNRLFSSSTPVLFGSPTGGRRILAPAGAPPYSPIWERVVPVTPLRDIPGDTDKVMTVNAFSARQARDLSVNARYPDVELYFSPLSSLGSSAYYINKQRTLNGVQAGSTGVFQSLSIPGLSPIRMDEIDIDPTLGFMGRGKLLPSIPLLAAADIDVVIQGAEVRIQKSFDLGDVNVPSPFHVDAASLSLFASSTNGLGLAGNVVVAIDHIGKCQIDAELSSGNGLLLSGAFTFDDGLFDGIEASVNASYHRRDIFSENDHGHWSVGGQIVIPRGKISGIETATVNLSYSDEEGFRAHGEATLSVPGVENGTIDISHNDEEGMVIAGQFNLRQGRGIRGGQISARVQEKPDGSGYAVSAHGEAQPDIPGINSNLIVDYNDGAFTAEVSADYSRGMLSGRVNAGVTNRSVNPTDGTLSATAEPNNPLVVYGGGQLTLQIAPWLQGTAGVRFAPNGEVTVTGEIGLPSQLEIFARKEINKSIFNIAVQAPIFPGIVAEVGGGLSATAGIGPGVLDRLSLGITYNPAHEDQTRITGDAHLNIPANAGLRLSVRAGIGLGITGASATGGLDIGGTLGIEGAAEAGVHVEWTPATGLDLRAEIAVHAQPSFTFDIGGYVSVRALGFEVYDNRWQFASYTFGSDYRFGIRLPIHYHEGEPFDISLDDVQFEVPNIDTDQLLRGLIARIA